MLVQDEGLPDSGASEIDGPGPPSRQAAWIPSTQRDALLAARLAGVDKGWATAETTGPARVASEGLGAGLAVL